MAIRHIWFVEIQDFELEEFTLSEPVGLFLHGFDFVAGFFRGTGGYGVIIISREYTAPHGTETSYSLNLMYQSQGEQYMIIAAISQRPGISFDFSK